MIGDACLVTVLELSPAENSVAALIVKTSPDASSLQARHIALTADTPADLGDDIRLKIVSIIEDKARIGFDVPTHFSVHRLEVYEAIRRENDAAARRRDSDADDDDEGAAGARVPRPTSPNPPSLDARLPEPPSESE